MKLFHWMIFIFVLFLIYPVKAQDISVANDALTETAPFVDCNNTALLDQVKQHLKDIVTYHGDNIVDKRRSVLFLKNIANFKEISAYDLSPEKTPTAMSRLTELKINQNLNEEQIQICRADVSMFKMTLYLVIYRIDGKTAVEIVNFGGKNFPYFFLNKINS